MIWPLLLALAGTGAQMAGAQKSQNATDSALLAELERQRLLREQAQAAANQSMLASTPGNVNATIQQGQEKHAAAYNAADAVPMAASSAATPLQQSSTKVSEARAGAEQERSNTARSNLVGYNEWDMQRAIKNLLAEQQLNLMNNFAAGSNAVLPTELNAAAHKGDSLTGLGQLLSTVGMMGSLGGLGQSAMAAPRTTYTATGQSMVPLLGSGQSMWGNAVSAAPQATNYLNFLKGY